MSEAPTETAAYELTCPHCRKPFAARLLAGRAARYEGFKCPHCRLFVPLARVEQPIPEQGTALGELEFPPPATRSP